MVVLDTHERLWLVVGSKSNILKVIVLVKLNGMVVVK